MISVSEALDHIFRLVGPVGREPVTLREAAGRVLAERVTARRDQPPFAASVMDGYAVRAEDAMPGRELKIVGEAAAGHGFFGRVGEGEAVRIFTGAPVPEGATRVIIQEDVSRSGDSIVPRENLDSALYIRPKGTDFANGDAIEAPRRISARDVALFAAMNVPSVTVSRRPVLALLSTGDELVMPGEEPGESQIIASNHFGLAALFEQAGAEVRLLPIARDTPESLDAALTLAEGADLIVTIGGASVGDHDIVGKVAAEKGMERAFYKVAMRPGKPLMAGRLKGTPMIGLPGNPVSSIVCGHIFILPALSVMLGLPEAPRQRIQARLTAPIAANGPREHYMRAHLSGVHVTIQGRQDSSLLSVLANANALAVRPPEDPARDAGETVSVIPLDRH